jgi:hypothetical protein
VGQLWGEVYYCVVNTDQRNERAIMRSFVIGF